MTITVQSQSKANKQYRLTIDDESGKAIGCSCPDSFYRKHECKHVRQFNQARKDEERTRYLNVALALGWE